MPDDIKGYRQALRDIPETCDISKFDGHEFKWPEKPEWFAQMPPINVANP